MTMANGAPQQQGKLQFKKRATVTEIRPDAPEGGWRALIPKGKSKAFVTAADKGSDPGIVVGFQLVKAFEEKNEPFQKSVITQRVTFYDPNDAERRKAANMQLTWMRSLCEALDLDFDETYPKEIESEADLLDLISKLEGKQLDIYTVHRKSQSASGEEMINVDIRFKPPGAGLATKPADADDEDEEKPGKRAKGGRGR